MSRVGRMVVELEHHSLSAVFFIPFLSPLSDILAPTFPQHGEPAMNSFFKDFPRGYRLDFASEYLGFPQ
jgi:hypothetical protein